MILWGVSKSYLGEGNAWSLLGNKQKACELYGESLKAYEQGKKENPNLELRILTGFKNMPEMINAFKRKEGCSAT